MSALLPLTGGKVQTLYKATPHKARLRIFPLSIAQTTTLTKLCLKIRTNEKITAANAEVKKLAEGHSQRYIDINRSLKDEQGRLKAEYTIEGMHINEDGYGAVYDDIMEYVREK